MTGSPLDGLSAEARHKFLTEAVYLPGLGPRVAFSWPDLKVHKFPNRPVILSRLGRSFMRGGDLGEWYASRGFGKSLLVQALGVAVASGGDVLGFEAPRPRNVLFIDGEMSGEALRDRFAMLIDGQGADVGDRLRVIAADWQVDPLPRLDTPSGQALIAAEVERADLIIIDNRSCLFDAEGETDPSKWTPAQEWLLALRKAGKAVILIHHSNRMGGARGHSRPEDMMDILVKLSRPEDYRQCEGSRVVVEFEKSRSVWGAAVEPFTAHLVDGRWTVEGAAEADDSGNRILSYLVEAEAVGDPVRSSTVLIRGAKVKKSEGLKAIKRLLDSGKVVREKAGFRVQKTGSRGGGLVPGSGTEFSTGSDDSGSRPVPEVASEDIKPVADETDSGSPVPDGFPVPGTDRSRAWFPGSPLYKGESGTGETPKEITL